MIDIVVFGKPRAFESFEFEFEGKELQTPENSHIEPNIKPKDFDEPIFHYFRKNDIVGWEVYRRCRGFDSDRQGIVFGIGIKTDKDFSLIESLGDLLMPYWEVFAQAFLDQNNKFRFDSIVGFLKTTKWGSDDEEKVRNHVSNNPIKIDVQEKGPLLLLAVPNIGELNSVENSIKEFNDVYIASCPEIFQDSINRDVLVKQANNEIHVVKDGKIEKSDNSKGFDSSGDEKEDKKRKWTWIWGGKSSNNTSDSDVTGKDDNKKPKIPSKLIAAAAIAIIIAVAWFVFPKLVNKPADRIELTKAPESGYITDGFDLQPKLYHGESERTSTKLCDIDLRVEGKGSQYVTLNKNDEKFIIVFKDSYYQEKHPETEIIVRAFVKDSELSTGNNIYKYKLSEYNGKPANYCELKLQNNNTPIQSKFPDNGDIIARLAYFDGSNYNNEICTTKDEISFTITPSGYAEIKKDNNGNLKLFVKNDRPKSDSNIEVTVMASLKDKEIGKQKYTIVAKKETTNTPSSVDVSGEIAYAKRTDFRNPSDANNAKDEHYILSSSLSIREGLTNYYFIARDKNGTKLLGTWKCSGIDLSDTKKGENPLNFASTPNPGTYILEYWVENKIRASIKITITEQ